MATNKRVRVRTPQGSVDSRVTAGTSTVFTPPAQQSENTAAQIAAGLSQVNPQVQKFLQKEHEEYKKEERKRGAKARLKNALEFKEAVQKGKIPESANPYFVQGYQEQAGKLKGQEYQQYLQAQYARSGVRNSTDPEEVESFLQEQRKKWTQNLSDNEDFQEGFLPQMQQAEANLRSQHSAQVQENIVEGKIRQSQVEIQNLVDEAAQGDWEPEQLAKKVEEIQQREMFVGLDGKRVNEMTVDAIAGKALRERDPELLDALDKIEAGSGKLGKTQYARKMKERTEIEIAQKVQQERRQARQRQERLEENALKRLGTELHNRLANAEDPSEVEVDDLYGTAAQFSPFAVDKLKDIRENYVEDKFVEDRDVVRELQVGVLQGDVGEEDVVEALKRGDLKPDTATSLISDIESRDSEEGPYQNDVLQDYSNRLHSTIAGNEGSKPMTRRLANEAVYEFQKDYAGWLAKNPEAGPEEMREKAQSLYDNKAARYSEDFTSEQLRRFKERNNIVTDGQSDDGGSSSDTSTSTDQSSDEGDNTRSPEELSESVGEGQSEEETEEVMDKAEDAGWEQVGNTTSTGINYDEPMTVAEGPNAPTLASPDDLQDMDAGEVDWKSKALFESLDQLRQVTEQYPKGPVASFLHSNGINPREFAQTQARLLRQQPGAVEAPGDSGAEQGDQQDNTDNEESSEE